MFVFRISVRLVWHARANNSYQIIHTFLVIFGPPQAEIFEVLVLPYRDLMLKLGTFIMINPVFFYTI